LFIGTSICKDFRPIRTSTRDNACLASEENQPGVVKLQLEFDEFGEVSEVLKLVIF
jgi:hypothetical protein